MYIFLIVIIVTGFIFALTAFIGYFLTGRKYKILSQSSLAHGLTAKRGFLFLLPTLKGSYEGFEVTVGQIPGAAASPPYYTFKVLFSPPLIPMFTFYKKSALDFSTGNANAPFKNRFKIFRDKSGIVSEFAKNKELTDNLLEIEGDKNTHTLLITQKMVYLSVLDNKEQPAVLEYYMDKIIGISRDIESISKRGA